MEFVPFGASDKIKLSVRIVADMIAVPTKRGNKPNEVDCMKFMMMCQAQRLNPFAGDAYMVGYDTQDGPKFSLITAIAALLKRAEVHPDFDGMESGVIILDINGDVIERAGDFHLEDERVIGGWAKVYSKKLSRPTYRRIRMARFNKAHGQWAVDPAGMIVKCAEADALRSTFPTMTGGLYLREELDFLPDTAPAQISRPMFEAPRQQQALPPTPSLEIVGEPVKEQEQEQSEQGNGQEQGGTATDEQAPPAQSEQRAGYNPLKALRNLAKLGKVKEGELLGYMSATGLTDGSHGSLEEVQIAAPAVIEKLAAEWGKLIPAINEWKDAQ